MLMLDYLILKFSVTPNVQSLFIDNYQLTYSKRLQDIQLNNPENVIIKTVFGQNSCLRKEICFLCENILFYTFPCLNISFRQCLKLLNISSFIRLKWIFLNDFFLFFHFLFIELQQYGTQIQNDHNVSIYILTPPPPSQNMLDTNPEKKMYIK